MPTASWLAASASSRRPRSASRADRVFSDPPRRPTAAGSSVGRGRPVLGNLLAGEGGGQRGELYAVLGHLIGERGGQAGLGCQLQREVEQVRELTCWGVDGGGEKVRKVVSQQPVQCSVDREAGVGACEFGQKLLGLFGHGDAGVAGED